ncbi:hypothetical protein MAR_033690 [Mya arenaria]|uniref:Serine protease n=1 Tax=Mya arenaria TaxID=6604 RepID=A0ABY7GD23_MYAAR|nr:uncharacterized protein LOC128224706 [Mya arenaria]XP_052790641.1 uncharacterized protein LOC128224706 [Mya arenaria]WAR31148.1 hypothetical protein MAR_033690 [Mya arenaria]
MGNLCCKMQDKKYKEKAEAKADGIETENKKEPAKNDRKKSPTSEDTSEHSKKMSPGDHGDTQSETTDSDSSDSSCGGAKKSKHGGVTVYKSSTTVVKGNKYKIDNNHGKLHIGDIGTQIVINKKKVKIFQNAGFDAKNATILERKLWASNSPTDCGSFINTRDKHLVMDYVFNLKVKSDATAWVGILKFRHSSGTCFRVGANKIMTALHVIKGFIDCEYASVRNIYRERPSKMFSSGRQASDYTDTDGHQAHDQTVLASLVDAYVDFQYLREDHQFPLRTRFKLKPLTSLGDIPFFDEATDCIVLELLKNDQESPMPSPFTFFSFPQFDKSFHLIGHPEGKRKKVDQVSTALDVTKAKTQADIKLVRDMSKQFIEDNDRSVDDFPYDFEGSANVDNTSRFLFHCCVGKGASGSPGVVVQDDGRVVVVTMLLHGYPDWYYSEKSDSFRQGWRQECCVEQGANMRAVYEKMLSNKTLRDEIFPMKCSPTVT